MLTVLATAFWDAAAPTTPSCATPCWPVCWSAMPCGVVGSFVVIRRISYIAGGIAHTRAGRPRAWCTTCRWCTG